LVQRLNFFNCTSYQRMVNSRLSWIGSILTCILLSSAFHFPTFKKRCRQISTYSQNIRNQEVELDYSVVCPALKSSTKAKSSNDEIQNSAKVSSSKKNKSQKMEKSVLEKYLEQAISRGHCGAAVRALEYLHLNSTASPAQPAPSVIDATTGQNLTTGLPVMLYGKVVAACIEQGNWVAAVRAFSLYAGKVGKEDVNQEMVMLLATGLAGLGQPEKAVFLLKGFLLPPTTLEERMFNIVLSRSADIGRVDLVEELCALMESLGLGKSCYTYALKVKAYGRAKDPNSELVDRALHEFQTKGISPDIVLMNSVVDAYVRCGCVTKAQKILEIMRKTSGTQESIRPNARTYNTVIKGLGQQGHKQSLQSAFELVAVMEKDGISVNEVTLNTLVQSCVRANLFNDAYRLLTAHTSTTGGVEAYTSLITGFAKQGDKEKALSVFKLMLEQGVPPNLFTYTALIDACSRSGDLVSAKNLLSFLTIKGQTEPKFAPGVVTYNCYITGLCRSSTDENMQEAMSILKQMQRQGLNPDQTTYNILIQGLVSFQHPRLLEAETMLTGMKRCGVRPSQVTYTILMKAYSRLGQLNKVQKLWKDMSQSKVSRPDTISLNTYLDACVKNGETKLALMALEDCNKGTVKIRPNLITYSIIILALARSSNLFAGGKAIALYREMRAQKIKPDRILVDGVLQACCNVRSRRGSVGLDIDFGKEIIQDIKKLGWSEVEVDRRQQLLRSFVPTLSEVWKSQGERKPIDSSRNTLQENLEEESAIPSAVQDIFEKHGWNKIDSGFNALF